MNEKNKSDELDAFWDLSSVVIQKKSIGKSVEPIRTAEVSVPAQKIPENKDSQSNTVIKRYIDPMHYENKKIKKDAIESSESYIPNSVLLHKVTLKKLKTQYDLYSDFLESALSYRSAKGKEVPYVEYYSYVPQYDQLSVAQLDYYLWWRDCFEHDVLIKTDLSYILLYVYEIINLGDMQDLCVARDNLAKLWNCYYKDFPALSSKLAVWICDFCLLHRLAPPQNIKSSVTKHTASLKEFFINIPQNDAKSCAGSLLKYGTEYDYRASKFATEKNIDIFDKHVLGAMITAVNFFSKDGRLLSELVCEDSKLIRNAFEGALCASKWKYEIEIRYCSFSRSNELRFIMGDIVKYAENKIRGFIGVKSKLSVYSISTELQNALNAYFDTAFANERPRVNKKPEEKHEYDVLYETKPKPFSLSEAKKIESESWGTTNELISAFEEDQNEEAVVVPKLQEEEIRASSDVSDDAPDLKSRLGEYFEFARAVKSRDARKLLEISKSFDMLPEAICDIINEICVDVIGDILIEDNGDGFEMIECYEDYIGD